MGFLPPHFEILIRDQCLAFWMPINNTFSRGHPKPFGLWNGFVLHFGAFKTKTGGNALHFLRSVSIDRLGGERIELIQGDDPAARAAFWINIIGGGAVPDDRPFHREELDDHFPFDDKIFDSFEPYQSGISLWLDRAEDAPLIISAAPFGAAYNHLNYRFQIPRTETLVEIYRPDQPGHWVLKDRVMRVFRVTISGEGGPGHGDTFNPMARP